MKISSTSLIGDDKAWYDNLPSKSIKTREDFESVFSKKWGDEKDMTLLFSQFENIHKHEQDLVSEFNARSDALIEYFPQNIRSLEGLILSGYQSALHG
jgi:hypothetical protein